MPHEKGSKKRSKRGGSIRSAEQLQEIEKRPKLQETYTQPYYPQSHQVYSDSKVTDVPGDTVASTPMERPHIFLSNSSLSPKHSNSLETQDVNLLDENSREEHSREPKQSPYKDAQEINEKTVTQVVDESLPSIIESADPHQAVQLPEGKIQKPFMKIFEKSNLKEPQMLTDNDILIIRKLLKRGAQVGTCFNGGTRPLYVAVEMADYDLVELLCQHLDQHQILGSQCGLQALVAAATSGRCDLIRRYIKYKDNVYGTYNDSPLDLTLSHGHLENAKQLIQSGAKMDIRSALQSAMTHQLPEYMKFILENYQPEVVKNFATKEATELNKWLVCAAQGGNLQIIGHLLDAGAAINQEGHLNETPLGVSKDGEVSKYLISRGANVNLLLGNGDSILLHILNKRNIDDSASLEVLKVLLENGASVNERGKRRRTPLMEAVGRKKSVGALQLLLDHGADINIQNEEGKTALMQAVCEGCPLIVSCLLQFHKEKSICINAQNHKGKTALMFAVTESGPEIVEQLINFAADVNVRDIHGNTALLHAVRGLLGTEILAVLLKANADLNSQNNEGFSPLMLAARRCWKKAILILLDSGADVNAVSENDKTKTALSYLPLGLCLKKKDFKDYFQPFLKNGGSLSYIDPRVIHLMISRSVFDSIPELIQAGLGPANVETKSLHLNNVDSKSIPTVSPLCMALLFGNVSLARYFVGNMFLTSCDVTSLTGNKVLRDVLEKRRRHDCLTFLDELSSQTWSLFQLTFVSLSSAVGSSPGRENRVSMLPLPQVIKDKLLFKSEDVQLNASLQDICSLEQDRQQNNFD